MKSPTSALALCALLVLVLCADIASAQSVYPLPVRDTVRLERPPVSRGQKIKWVVSIAAVVAANAFDANSSRGRFEANPLLRGADGRFSSSRGIAIKVAGTGGMLLLQGWLARRHPETIKSSTYVNFTSAAALSALAIRNGTVKK